MEMGKLHGLAIFGDQTICYRLFANDMGMFILANEATFKESRMAIALYELALGVRLNLAKSIIIPFGVLNIPLWLLNLG